MSTTTTTVSRINTVCVVVRDTDKAIGFYVDTLGLEKRADVPFGPGLRWVEVAPAGADTTIALAPPPEEMTEVGGAQTGISLQTNDIDALHAEWRARGVDADAEISRMGDPVPPLFFFRDPEGNVLMVVEAP